MPMTDREPLLSTCYARILLAHERSLRMRSLIQGVSFKRMRGLIQGFYELWMLLAFTHSLIIKQWRDIPHWVSPAVPLAQSFEPLMNGMCRKAPQSQSKTLEFWKTLAVSVPVPVNLPFVNLSRKRACFLLFFSCSFVWTLTKVEDANNNWTHNIMLKRQTCYMVCYWLKFCGSFTH